MKFKRITIYVILAVAAGLFTLTLNTFNASAETMRLSGGTLNLNVFSAPDSLIEDLEDFIAASQDTASATHADLVNRAKLLADSLQTLHSRLETLEKARADTLTKVSTDTGIARTKATAATDTLTKVSTDTGITRTKATANGDTLTKVSTDTGINRTKITAMSGALGVFYEQADVPLTLTADSDSAKVVLQLKTASTRYALHNLRIKSADPGANTVTVYLYELINDVQVNVDTFAITTSNFTNHFSLADMFGVNQIFGDNIMVTVAASAGSYAITGQYNYAKTNN